MSFILRSFVLYGLVLVLSACGGGGGGAPAKDLSLNTNSVSFSASQNGALPAAQTLQASWSKANVVAIIAGYPPSVTPPAWLDITIPGSGNPLPIQLSVNTTNLAPGNYSTTVRVVSVDVNANPIDIIDVRVSYSVESRLGLSGSSSMTFSMVEGGAAPSAQSIGLVGDNISWTAVSSEAWIQLGSASGTAPSTVSIGVDPALLASGTHTATVTFSDTASADNVTVNVTLQIQPPIGVSNSALTYHMVIGGQAPLSQTITVTGSGLDWSVAASAAWLQPSASSGTAPSTVDVAINPSGLGVGTHTATLTFSDTTLIQSATVDVTLIIQDQLAIAGSDSLTFAMVDTGLAPLDQTVSLTGTGVNWVATPSDPWVRLGSSSGTAAGDVSVGVDPSALAAGIHTATVEFADTQNLQSVILNVELRIEPHRLMVDDNGIALTSTPALSQLTASVSVNENAGVTTPWTAASNAAWLSVTASGDSGNAVDLTADPTGLAPDQIHYATVTLTSSDTSITNSETIRVGLWVGSVTPVATASLNLTYTELETDPIRPYVYMHNNGTAIDVYNVHTATWVATINNVAAQAGDMQVSSDGARLYVADLTNYDIVPVDLDTLTVGTAWDLSGSGALALGFGRVDNKALVFTGSGTVYDAATGAPLPNTFSVNFYSSGLVVHASRNGRRLCAVKTGISPYSVGCYTLQYSELGGGLLTMTHNASVRGPGSNAKDIAVTADGSRVYVAAGAPYQFIGFNSESLVQDQTLPADAYPNCVEISADNLLYGGISGLYGPLDVWIYNASGVEQGSYYLSGYAKSIRDRQLVVSGDGLRMLVSVSDPAIKIITVK